VTVKVAVVAHTSCKLVAETVWSKLTITHRSARDYAVFVEQYITSDLMYTAALNTHKLAAYLFGAASHLANTVNDH
jgi:hypothetical protein